MAGADAVKVAPNIYKVLLENDRVRVLEATLKPGEKAAMHSHPDTVVFFRSDARAKFSFPDGTSRVIEGTGGQALWIEAQTHAVDYLSNAQGQVVIVELK